MVKSKPPDDEKDLSPVSIFHGDGWLVGQRICNRIFVSQPAKSLPSNNPLLVGMNDLAHEGSKRKFSKVICQIATKLGRITASHPWKSSPS
jgi:hypothetical protein